MQENVQMVVQGMFNGLWTGNFPQNTGIVGDDMRGTRMDADGHVFAIGQPKGETAEEEIQSEINGVLAR